MVHIRFVKKIYKNNQPVTDRTELEMVKHNLESELLSLPNVHKVFISLKPNTNELHIEYYRDEETLSEKLIYQGKVLSDFMVSLFK